MVGLDADPGAAVRVVHHDVGVRAGRDDALARVEAEHAGRRRGDRLHPPLQRQLAVDHALVQQVDAVLDAADAVGNLGEVADAQLLLVLEAERAVVGGDHGEVVGAQPLPQVLLVRLVLAAQRGRADPLGAFEAGRAELVLQREVQVLRAGLGEHVAAGVAGGGHLGEGAAGGQVHDVERAVLRHLGQHDRPVRRLGLQGLGAGDAVVDRVGLAAGEGLLHEHVDRDAVFRVHHDDRAVVTGLLHGAQDLAVVGVEDARVRHEKLEARDPLADELVHRLERVVVDAAEDHVERVVDVAVAVGLGVPGGEPVLHHLAGALHREVDDRGGAAERGRLGARVERVRRERPPNGSSMWVCASMPPGMTYLPVASRVWVSAGPAPGV
ncbi:hypothetical protein Phou_087220 [Phytohabitans houttuyneae]|uniref:Uncharacterized protein n=1 Tax=Phytohabitans houttuyneae TaxID=1076126 RepID=A0A6V8KH45_9ACTN|nr:hypothetical protein Phou_087220 [Phytohabitans houttuyneae]